MNTHNCVVLRDVDGHDHIGNGRAFNHSALYWHKQELVAPDPGELKGAEKERCIPSAEDKPSYATVDEANSEAKMPDESTPSHLR